MCVVGLVVERVLGLFSEQRSVIFPYLAGASKPIFNIPPCCQENGDVERFVGCK